ncbi:hypothetical protein RND71_038027 [Anisodus tanguticus]|uniref:DUF4283 domain-containing protein n=1 Tax=Anisodus tanguticus TaxID=243964 RepID=A0AAE1QZR2_9SOLA|nr:hypothetical protein RND71_038027 [Anisodus tanguticus]
MSDSANSNSPAQPNPPTLPFEPDQRTTIFRPTPSLHRHQQTPLEPPLTTTPSQIWNKDDETLAAKTAEVADISITHGTHLGKPAVYFNAQDYFVNLAKEFKFTIVGKFINGKPNMEELRKLFFSQYLLKGKVNIAYYDYRIVYIDFANETDYNHIYFNPFIHIGQYIMKVQKWTPDTRNFHSSCLDSYSQIAMAPF